MEYLEYIASKGARTEPVGFEPGALNTMLFPWQADIVRWACRRGRACIFADCGLGKTAMQLEWARCVQEETGGMVLILAPLAVASQTEREGAKFGIAVDRVTEGFDGPAPGIYVTNYERMERFDLASFAGVVLDESSILKSHDSKTRMALTGALDAVPYVLCCTATPAPNDQMELGTHAEIAGAMKREEMLATWFVHDGSRTSEWRLKGHAEADFYRWMATWAVMLSRPSDIGYPDDGFDMPGIEVSEVVAGGMGEASDGRLFAVPADGLTEQRRARKAHMAEKVEAIAEMVNASAEQWCVWCDYNDESAALAAAVPDAVEVKGSDSPEWKTEAMNGFSEGRYRVIVSKPSICGFGMNWQNCHNVAFCGMSYSYEQYYQAVRRCWRFGQEHEVTVLIFTSEEERASLDAVMAKEDAVEATKRGMVEAMAEETVRQIQGADGSKVPDAAYADAEGDGWQMLLGDCVERIAEVPDGTVGLSVFSPPFASLYTYSDSPRDMGNCRDDEEFWGQFSYLVPELFRVLMPGRCVCIHCMNLPTTKARDGFIGIRDFRGDIIRMFQGGGFVYHSEVCIWKNPVTAMQRTKALGLLHKTIRKDSSMSRQGIPDYVVVMRKPGENPEPIAHTSEEFPVSKWQEWASPVWMDINQSDTLNGRAARDNGDEKHICPLQLPVIERCVGLWSNPGDLVLSPFGGIGSEGYQSLLMGREYIGIELKPSYYREAVRNLRTAETMASQRTLF